MPNTYETLLFFHILGAFLILAGAGVGTATGIAMTRTNNVRTIGTLAQLGQKAERFANTPGGLLTFIFGTWLISEGDWDFGALWISLIPAQQGQEPERCVPSHDHCGYRRGRSSGSESGAHASGSRTRRAGSDPQA